MAINYHPLPTPTDSKLGLRSYREATSYLVQNESLSRGVTSCEACEPRPSPECGAPPSPRPRPTPTASGSSALTPSTRCRARTASPPPAPSVPPSPRGAPSKAPRSVSPGGTPDASAGAALRRSLSARDPAAPRRVRWADALVTAVRARPRTPRADVAALFYSRADERRFRREAARDARRPAEADDRPAAVADHQGLWAPTRERKDYGISKAVVVFGDATRTYGGGVLGGCAVEALQAKVSSFAFDDAAFWNGQLTWS